MELNPLDWPAEPFLEFYLFLTAVAVAVTLVLRSEVTHADTAGDGGSLSPLELALLSGGVARAADTALVELVVAGAVRLDPKRPKISFETTSEPLPQELAGLRGSFAGVTTRAMFHKAVMPQLQTIKAGLGRRRLTPSAEEAQRLSRYTLGVLAVPIMIGIAKIIVGLSRDRPVGILTVLVLGTMVLAIVLAARPPLRTRAGTAALDEHRDRHARAARAPLEGELPLAFALTGAAVLAGTALAPLARQIRADGSGCGGDGGGGGGGGCGGCSA